MPEGPELYLSSVFVNNLAQGLMFCGQVDKSEVARKLPSVDWNVPQYSIRAESRGKEMKLFLKEIIDGNMTNSTPQEIFILFHFGMSGYFTVTSPQELPKHSHLRFYSKPSESAGTDVKVLSFVDPRRFGKWMVNADWGLDRGPCPISDYENFRKNILDHIEEPTFKNKAICEVMLNQRFFNGIGNYLRAEVLFRAGVPPFAEAYATFVNLKKAAESNEGQKGKGLPFVNEDLLYLCHALCWEVVQLKDGYGSELKNAENTFINWLRCYQNPQMKSLPDKNKRTCWFAGDPGPLAPKSKSRLTKAYKRPGESTKALNKPSLSREKVSKLELESKPAVVALRRSSRLSTVNK